MPNELSLPGNNLPQKYNDSDFDSVARSGNYLPRLQLMTANSKQCKSGDFPINSYALVNGDSFIDLGKTIDIGIICWRPKAIDMGGEQVVASYNIQNDLFRSIQAKSEIQNSMCMAGPEFLVWIPNHGYATFFMGSKSAKRESQNIKSLIGKTATLTSKYAENSKGNWYHPTGKPCSAMIDSPTDLEEFNKVVEAFNNPPESEIEKVEDTEERAR